MILKPSFFCSFHFLFSLSSENITCNLACRKLTELDIQENGIDDISGSWLSAFPDNFTSLEILNFASLNSEVSFDALERLVSRCKSLKVLKVNKGIGLDQLQSLLFLAPQLVALGTCAFQQEIIYSN